MKMGKRLEGCLDRSLRETYRKECGIGCFGRPAIVERMF